MGRQPRWPSATRGGVVLHNPCSHGGFWVILVRSGLRTQAVPTLLRSKIMLSAQPAHLRASQKQVQVGLLTFASQCCPSPWCPVPGGSRHVENARLLLARWPAGESLTHAGVLLWADSSRMSRTTWRCLRQSCLCSECWAEEREEAGRRGVTGLSPATLFPACCLFSCLRVCVQVDCDIVEGGSCVNRLLCI